MKRLFIIMILSVFVLTGCEKPLENVVENEAETQSAEPSEQTPKEVAQEKESVDHTTEKEKSAPAETEIATPTPEDETTNTTQTTDDSNEKVSMTDDEIKALLKKYDNIKTVDKVKEMLRNGLAPEDLELLLQDMLADRAKYPEQQQQTQTTPQNNTPTGTGYGGLMPEGDLDPNYVHGQSGSEGLSTTGYVY